MLPRSQQIMKAANTLHKGLIMQGTNLTSQEDKLVMGAIEHLEDYANLVTKIRRVKMADLF